jgi:hypothetical protein
MRRWDKNGSYFMHSNSEIPIFVASFQHCHYGVAFAYTERYQRVRHFVAHAFDFRERYEFFPFSVVAPYDGRFVGARTRQFIRDVIAEIELFRFFYGEIVVKIFVGIEFSFTVPVYEAHNVFFSFLCGDTIIEERPKGGL